MIGSVNKRTIYAMSRMFFPPILFFFFILDATWDSCLMTSMCMVVTVVRMCREI